MRLFISTLVCVLVLYGCSEPEGLLESPPNIVFIFADDLGYGDLGCFGASDIKTPHIDRIAAEGIQFTEFYSASSICSPSRAGLMTGRLPARMGIYKAFFPSSFTGMPGEEITMAEMLKKKGYATGVVGKWHLGHMSEYLPLQQGFDYYYGIPYSNDMRSVVYMKGNEVDSFKVNQAHMIKTYVDRSLDFIEEHKSAPFFLYLAHNMPHVPLHASADFVGSSERGLYGDVVQEIDWSVGQVLQSLEDNDLLENTIVVFSSDNGPWLAMEDHGGSAGPLREGKFYTFEGGMRVPTVAMWKGKVKPRVYTQPATQMDWFPTFAELADVDLPLDRPIDGESLVDMMVNGGEREGQEIFYFNGAGKLSAYRNGDFKVKVPFQGFESTIWNKGVAAHDSLLFNLKTDPSESTNLFGTTENGAALFIKQEQALSELGELPPPVVIHSLEDNSHYEYLSQKHNGVEYWKKK